MTLEAAKNIDYSLGKPPIVEAWISATFVPYDDSEPWNWDSVVDYLHEFAPELE